MDKDEVFEIIDLRKKTIFSIEKEEGKYILYYDLEKEEEVLRLLKWVMDRIKVRNNH